MNTKSLNTYILSGVIALAFVAINTGSAVAAASSTSAVASTTIATSSLVITMTHIASTTMSTSTVVRITLATSTVATSTLPVGSCPLITSRMQPGIYNDPSQVIKLQAFLKNNEKLDVDLTGVYDAKTVTAVKAFQATNISETMAPWHSKTPSGNVGITTSKTINKIACNIPLTLSMQEMNMIEAYLTSTSTLADNTVGPTLSVSTSTDTDNTASVDNASVLQRIGNFLKSIF